MTILLNLRNPSSTVVFFIYAIIGLSLGYWATLITCAAEQFGTNLRATVATSVPNFVRALAIPITLSFDLLRQSFGITSATFVIACSCCLIGAFALWLMDETFGKELDYIETDEISFEEDKAA